MLRLTTKLACSNLIKNRKLYYPFAIAVILAVTIAYLFDSLTFNPRISELRGGLFYSVHPQLGILRGQCRGGHSSCFMPIASS